MISDRTYVLNEGTLPIAPFDDRSVNILSLERAEGATVQIIISRDSLLPGEDVAASATRQLKNLARQTQAFKENRRAEHAIGPAQLAGLLLETQFKQNGQNIYQAQAMVSLPTGNLLILTLNSPVPISDTLRAQWHEILNGFVPAMPIESPNPSADASPSSI